MCSGEEVTVRFAGIETELARMTGTLVALTVLQGSSPDAAFLEATIEQQGAVVDALVTVLIDRAAPGAPRVDPETVRFEWHGTK